MLWVPTPVYRCELTYNTNRLKSSAYCTSTMQSTEEYEKLVGFCFTQASSVHRMSALIRIPQTAPQEYV